jgi:hypothetical protein
MLPFSRSTLLDGALLSEGREDGKVDFRVREVFDHSSLASVKQEWRELILMDLETA